MGGTGCAGVGTGLFEDFSAISRFFRIESVRMPDTDSSRKYERTKADFDRYYAALKPVFADRDINNQEE